MIDYNHQTRQQATNAWNKRARVQVPSEVIEAVMTLVVFAEDRGLTITAALVREWLTEQEGAGE